MNSAISAAIWIFTDIMFLPVSVDL